MAVPRLLHHLLDGPASAGGREAIVDGADRVSYDALRGRVTVLADRLRTAGVGAGDRVGILLPKSAAECAAIFAVSLAGGVVVPIHPSLKPPQVRHILDDCGAGALVSDATSDPLSLGGGDRPDDTVRVFALAPRDGPPPPENLAAILYTSGSTGLPKGVMLSHANLLAGTRIVRGYLGIGPDDRLLSVLPLSFDYGLNQLLTSVEQGACLVLHRVRFGDALVAALAEHRITGLAGVPTLWTLLTRAAPSLAATALPHLRYLTNSGGAVPPETVARLARALPDTDIVLMYGLTEAFRSTWLPPGEVARRPGSIGRAIPETEVFCVDARGRRTGPGEPGILMHRGPTVSLGYWNRPEDTARVIVPDPDDPAAPPVCRSGDLAVVDADGYFTFLGRADALIKSAGFRISPNEVEAALMETGAFRSVAVIGLPDPDLGQRVHAVAVAAQDGPSTQAAMTRVRTRLAPHMVPRAIEAVEALPVTPNGKVDYTRLVAERTDHAPSDHA
ncbi:AMP-dependent synthetase [Methylobacterium sp. Leaf399]|uniref:AMP-binding protein n=1 Tax=Methylobacterium sp. Leaf399 TaxID=1736364 RepID=UPI0006FA56AA|nr:AMP-binding protein [Methylobacterium sp. Leaf399]KQT07469.1 AMP-dependent synthetase [Methylobacterium sp. Leaf399]